MLKIALLAPMPRASVAVAVAAKSVTVREIYFPFFGPKLSEAPVVPAFPALPIGVGCELAAATVGPELAEALIPGIDERAATMGQPPGEIGVWPKNPRNSCRIRHAAGSASRAQDRAGCGLAPRAAPP